MACSQENSSAFEISAAACALFGTLLLIWSVYMKQDPIVDNIRYAGLIFHLLTGSFWIASGVYRLDCT